MGLKRSSSGGGGGGGGPAPFLVKTYEMVEEKETEEVISWGEKGASFVVWKPAEFARDLLPLHFKHNNFSSFVRQLNTYGFRKVVPDRWEFTNDNFRRGEQGLLSNIRRRKPPAPGSRLPSDGKPSSAVAAPRHSNLQLPPPSSTSNSAELHSSSSAASPPSAAAEDQLLGLANENEQLRKDNRVLSAELSRAKCRFHELLAFLSKHVDVGKLDFRLLMEAKEEEENDDDDDDEEGEEGVKLFGVLLQKKKAKRRRCEGGGADGCQLPLPWMGISRPLQQESGKVCN